MIYLSDNHISTLGTPWKNVIATLKESVQLLYQKDYVQPVKPYLRYKDLTNRIIAMPAFLGGNINKSGIKWIASFPSNLKKGLARAHSVTVLNEADTGIPFCIINTNRVSAIRTAGISGLMLQEFLNRRKYKDGSVKIGIIGFGPIGQFHADMLYNTCFKKISSISVYDIREVALNGLPNSLVSKISIAKTWEEAYTGMDIVITCTVSSARYINLPPKPGSLHLNVSLRDYEADAMAAMKKIIVDDWDEICRENTDIEMMHLTRGLQKSQTLSFTSETMDTIMASVKPKDTVMFNPMGMAIFDIAVAWLYYNEARKRKINIVLE
jgi:N-[(2S)-2-amino-2-carboxyethyl]-L-glutamate dehydrogenase